jgi:hypothetical protein
MCLTVGLFVTILAHDGADLWWRGEGMLDMQTSRASAKYSAKSGDSGVRQGTSGRRVSVSY